jgi:hypothetical protein
MHHFTRIECIVHYISQSHAYLLLFPAMDGCSRHAGILYPRASGLSLSLSPGAWPQKEPINHERHMAVPCPIYFVKASVFLTL